MALELRMTAAFAKDLRRVRKQGKNIDKLEALVDMIQNQQPLPFRCRARRLRGNRMGHWDCHIEPDWLLPYRLTDAELVLVRTGSHAELFES